MSRRASILFADYRQSRDVATLREAVKLLRRATSVADPPATWLSNLGAAAYTLFRDTGEPGMLTEAVTACRHAVELAPDSPRYLSNLAAALEILFQEKGDTDVAMSAVRYARLAVSATIDDNDPALSGRRANLVNSLRTVFVQTGDTEFLLEAVTVGRQAVATALEPGEQTSIVLSNFANAAWDLSERIGDEAIMWEAVAAFQAAFDATPTNHPNRAAVLANLAQRRGAAAARVGDTKGVHDAVDIAMQAIRATREDSPDRSHVEGSLAGSLRSLFNHTGDVDALVESVRLTRLALARTPADNPDLGARLSEFGITLRSLYERTGELSTLVDAVKATMHAVRVLPVGHVRRPGCLVNAANAQFTLSDRVSTADAATMAVTLARQAVSELRHDHPGQLGNQAQMIVPLVTLALRTDDVRLLDEAVSIGRGTTALPEGHPDLAGALSNTAYALLKRYPYSKKPADLIEAMDLARRSAELVEQGSVSSVRILLTLGGAQLAVAEGTRKHTMIDDARATFARVVGSPAVTARERILAWRGLGRVELLADLPAAAVTAFEHAVDLVPLLAPRRLPRGDREFGLGQVAGLASEAAGAATAAGRPGRAAELLELARTLLQSETIDVRGDLRTLRALAPELNAEFHRIRNAMDALDHPAEERSALTSPRRRAQITHEWDDLLERIRSLRPELDRFLLAPALDRLRRQAAAGPIVFVYASRHRSDALVLRDDAEHPVEVVPLRGVSDEMVEEQVERFRTAHLNADQADTYAGRKAAQLELHEVLSWLWDHIAEPVLDELDLSAPPSNRDWPRLWWCPIGTIGSLPLHAAGHHLDIDNPHRTVLDRTVSSYATSVRGLTHARRPGRPESAPSAVVVAMPETPAAGPLPSSLVEAADVLALVPDSTKLVSSDATREAVIAELARHAIAHFACHAVGDRDDPGSGRLLCHDHLTNPLTVAMISQLDLEHAGLAFLSACHTSETSPVLADEVIHITSACHLAGYRNVIGTVSPVGATAARIAVAVYGFLTDGGTTTARISDTAIALHHAIRLLRATYPTVATTWAAAVHVGG